MKADELMVGDWVCTEHDTIPRQIDWIRTGEVGLLWNKVVTPPYLVPVPLTPEIMEKNGFNLTSFDGKIGKYWEIPEFVMGEFGQISIGQNNIRIEYIHELQHALRLCGINKEIIV